MVEFGNDSRGRGQLRNGLVAGVGGSTSLNYNVVREPTGLVSMFTIEQGLGLGFDVDATVSMSATWYTGERHNVSARNMLTGLNVYMSVGAGAGIKGGYSMSVSAYLDSYGHEYRTFGFEGGLGLPVGPLPFSGSFGMKLGLPLERGWKKNMKEHPIFNTPIHPAR